MSETVTADDGTMLPLASLDTVVAYSGGNPTTFTVVYRGNTYVQTLTYSGTNVIDISGWIKQ